MSNNLFCVFDRNSYKCIYVTSDTNKAYDFQSHYGRDHCEVQLLCERELNELDLEGVPHA